MEPRLMKRDVWITADCIVSPLGVITSENYKNMKAGKTGIDILNNPTFFDGSVHAAFIHADIFNSTASFSQETLTRFESLAILSIENACRQIQLDLTSDKTVFVLSTTKGNIELLNETGNVSKKIHLHEAANIISKHFGNNQKSIVVSNACVSGVMAILVAKRLIQSGRYDHAVVIGADVLTKFVLSGFQSLNAISPEACRPFDIKRKGVTLGEAAATVILSVDPDAIHGMKKIKIMGGGLSNDANHISGPSRTGAELSVAVNQALNEAGLTRHEIDFISAHGTATLYNDEMEAKAFNLSGMADIPLNSLKGYFGHTLGAAGIVETIVSVSSLLNNELVPTFGFEELGVSQPVNVIRKFEAKEITTCLKTASGFGGCNAAIVLNKVAN